MNRPRTWRQWEKYLWSLYDEFERKYFRGRMPRRINVRWGIAASVGQKFEDTLSGHAAEYKCTYGRLVDSEWEIIIDWTIRDFDDIVCITLLHEMAHVVADPSCGHGPRWRAEIHRLKRIGAYDDFL